MCDFCDQVLQQINIQYNTILKKTHVGTYNIWQLCSNCALRYCGVKFLSICEVSPAMTLLYILISQMKWTINFTIAEVKAWKKLEDEKHTRAKCGSCTHTVKVILTTTG